MSTCFYGVLEGKKVVELTSLWKHLTGKQGDRALTTTMRHLGIKETLGSCPFPAQPGHTKDKNMPCADGELLKTLLSGLSSDILEAKQNFIQEKGTAIVAGHVALKFFSMQPDCAKALEEGLTPYVQHPCLWNHRDNVLTVHDRLRSALAAADLEDFVDVTDFQQLLQNAFHVAGSVSQKAAKAAESEETRASRIEKLQAFWDDDRKEAFGQEVSDRYTEKEYYERWTASIQEAWDNPEKKKTRLAKRQSTLANRTDAEKAATALLKRSIAQKLWENPEKRAQLCANMKLNWEKNKTDRVARSLLALGEEGLRQRNEAISRANKQRFVANPELGVQRNQRLNAARAAKRADIPARTVEQIREKKRNDARKHRAKKRAEREKAGIPNGRSSEAVLRRLENPEAMAARKEQLNKAREASKRRREALREAEDLAVVKSRRDEQKRRYAAARKAKSAGSSNNSQAVVVEATTVTLLSSSSSSAQ